MKMYKTLVLTDHSGHSIQNSIYAILREMLKHPQCQQIDIASRGLSSNDPFFKEMQVDHLMGTTIDSNFNYTPEGLHFSQGLRQLNAEDYDLLFLRLPRPISDEFLLWISEVFSHTVIINHPKGIISTSNKKFLLNFPSVCPDIRLCTSISDVIDEVAKYPIVLKPLKEYGGRGLLKINSEELDDGSTTHQTHEYLKTIETQLQNDGYLSMRFLKNVNQGDKRILIADGEVMAASLRLPAKDSWLCNVAQGGTSIPAEVTQAEIDIVQRIKPMLRDAGIFMYGVDTLVDDDGQRVLSEVNTLSIGGWPQAEEQTGLPLIKSMIKILFQYADRHQ